MKEKAPDSVGAIPVPPDVAQVAPGKPARTVARERRGGWLSLDLDPGQVLLLYLCLVVLVARWTVFSWLNLHALGAGQAGVFRVLWMQFMVAPTENALSTVACVYLHLLPYYAYRKARRLGGRLSDEISLSRQILDKAQALEKPSDPSLIGLGFEKLEQSYFGADLIGPSQQSLAAARIKIDVFRRIRQMRFEPTGALIQPYREELLGQVPDITKYQRISLQLGILLTFFGLMWVFGSSEFLGTAESGGTTLLSKSLFSALNLAFGSSAAGLLSSISVILLADSLRMRLLETFRVHEVMAEGLNAVAQRAYNDPRLHDSLRAAENALHRVNAALDLQITKTSVVVDVVKDLSEVVGSATPQVASAVRSLHEEIAALNARQAEMITQLQATFTQLTPTALGQALAQGLDSSLKELAQAMNSAAANMASVERAVLKVETMHLDSMGTWGEMARQLGELQHELARLRPTDVGSRWAPTRWWLALRGLFRRT